MGPHERPRFASDAWGHLIRLSRSGILGTVELEHVIERALMQIDGRISLSDLRSLLSDAGLEGIDDTDTPPTLH
jgi:Smg protein